MKLKPWVKFTLTIIILVSIFTFCPKAYDIFKELTITAAKSTKKGIDKVIEKVSSKQDTTEYEECLKSPFSKEMLSAQTQEFTTSLDNYLQNLGGVSLKYEDLTSGFEYHFKSSETVYAASTIKLLDALYLYKQADEGNIDLNETITYTSSYIYSSSKGMQNHQLNENISLKTLVKYAVIYSDNSAHQMLIDYIGFDNLKAFGNNLGATTTLVGGDNFGNLSANDGILYLKELYNFFQKNNDLSNELKQYFLEAEENAIKYPELTSEVAHKYGYYQAYFNDLAIVYDPYPYALAVTTLHGQSDYIKIVNDISRQINELHQKYITDKKNYCQDKT